MSINNVNVSWLMHDSMPILLRTHTLDRMNILYPTFCVTFCTCMSINNVNISDCVWFVFILNLSYFIRNENKHVIRCNWWSIKWKIKSEIEDLHSSWPSAYIVSCYIMRFEFCIKAMLYPPPPPPPPLFCPHAMETHRVYRPLHTTRTSSLRPHRRE